jgi:hypothetical protein
MNLDRQINTKKNAIVALLPVVTALTLSGCWTPPNANVQPKGEPRLIQGGIPVESVKEPATVESVDASQRIVTFKVADGSSTACKVGLQVKDFDKLQAGDQVKVTLAEELAVYILKNGRLADETIPFNAKVQSVDPSYRLLTLQYLDGKTETFKVGLDTKVLEMQPGDDVVVKTTEAKTIRIEK